MDIMAKLTALSETTIELQGERITYDEFRKGLEKVKTYIESSHKDRVLYRDPKGRFWLWEFDEYVTFDDRGDLMNETFTLVESEVEADSISKESILVWKTKPYIHIDDRMVLHSHLGGAGSGR